MPTPIEPDNLLAMFEMAGGTIKYFKKSKYIANVLSVENPPYLNYHWGRRFFGAYNRTLTDDIDYLDEKGYIQVNIFKSKTKSKKKFEPFHKKYTVTETGRKIALKKIEQQMEHDKEYTMKIIAKATALNMLPPAANLNIAFSLMGAPQREYPIPVDVSVIYLDKGIKIDLLSKKIVNGCVDRFRKKGMSVSESSNEFKLKYDGSPIKTISTEIHMKPELARKRYEYLHFTNNILLDCENILEGYQKKDVKKNIYIKEKIESNISPTLIKEYPALEGIIEEQLFSYINTLKKNKNAKYWDDIMDFLSEIYNKTEKNPLKLIFSEKPNAFILIPSDEIKKFIETEGRGTFDQLWHTIQPCETLGDILNEEIRCQIRDERLTK